MRGPIILRVGGQVEASPPECSDEVSRRSMEHDAFNPIAEDRSSNTFFGKPDLDLPNTGIGDLEIHP